MLTRIADLYCPTSGGKLDQYILIIHCHNGQIIANIQIIRKSESRIAILHYSLSLGHNLDAVSLSAKYLEFFLFLPSSCSGRNYCEIQISSLPADKVRSSFKRYYLFSELLNSHFCLSI